VTIDPRLLATFDPATRSWHVAAGRYTVTLADSSGDPGRSVTVQLGESTFRHPGE
jgi:beta-glucosidase